MNEMGKYACAHPITITDIVMLTAGLLSSVCVLVCSSHASLSMCVCLQMLINCLDMYSLCRIPFNRMRPE